MMLFMLTRESYRNFGSARSEARFSTLGTLFALLVIGYSVARYMKKTGKLRAE